MHQIFCIHGKKDTVKLKVEIQVISIELLLIDCIMDVLFFSQKLKRETLVINSLIGTAAALV